MGCGYSSCAIMDANELLMDFGIDCTFVEPHPELLLSLLEPGDPERIHLLPTSIQEVALERFAALARDDILFVDSSHVSKAGGGSTGDGRGARRTCCGRSCSATTRSQSSSFNSHLARYHRDALGRALPLALANPGTSLWLRKGAGSVRDSVRGD